jgi:hypothetical protein
VIDVGFVNQPDPLGNSTSLKGLYIAGFNDSDFGINLQASNDYGWVLGR